MSDILEEQKTKVVNFSDINNVELKGYRTEIPIKPSDDPRCIYKMFKQFDGYALCLNIEQNHGSGKTFLGFHFGSNVPRRYVSIYELEPKHENWKKKFTEPAIELILNEKIQQVVPRYAEDYHQKDEIGIKGETTSLAIVLPNFSNGYKGELRERDGEFFNDVFGVWFELKNVLPRGYNSIVTIEQLYNIKSIATFENPDQLDRFLAFKAKQANIKFGLEKKYIEGVTKTFAVVEPFFNEVLAEGKNITGIIAFKHTIEASKRSINNVKFSVIFNKIFGEIKTKEAFELKIKELAVILNETNTVYGSEDRRDFHERILDTLPEAREIKKEALKRKSTGAINKIMDDLDFIKFDKDKYPLTHEAIFGGEIPKGTFFRKNGDSYFIYNDNWDIWEEMLALHREVAISIATECSRRTTFEKDIMSYFFFVLHKLPEYLEKQTGKPWKCFPKLVSAEKELEPPTEGSNGVAKTRSALTPIVDNEKNEVVVPYVSMRLTGYSTSYCYGLDYNVLERGMSFKGNSVTKDVEKNLNGRDDYGLMFYTLTGSDNVQGYPTFLIIFEHLDTTTRVHFHRTHPMRSKGGDYNPIHGWTIGCYKWMVGNVNFERIKAQQGDLVFVSLPEGVEIPSIASGIVEEVNAYDNHVFATPVKFYPYTKKEKNNILGYFRIEKDTMLNHNEHKPRLIPAGDYELRQCRSWEANPKGVWSLRID